MVVVGIWEGYRYAKLHLALKHARREASNRQFMRAEFWTGRALGVDATSIDAARLMAEINEAQDKPAALAWRTRVAQLAPHSTSDIMAWAKSAYRFGQREMAVSALKNLPQDFQDHSAEYHELMAGYALQNRQNGLAEMHFARAAELDPSNPVHRVNLASFRLANSPNPEVRAAAARDLEGMVNDPHAGLFAIRALLTDAIHRRDAAEAQPLAEKLRALPEHTIGDDLNCLETVQGEAAFHAALDAVERRAESEALWTHDAGDWLNGHGMAAETLRWFAQLPEAIRSNVRVQMTMAEAYSAVADWTGLQNFLVKCHWDDGEFLRRAMLIRCQRALAQPWEKDWSQLATDVDANPPEGFLLAQLVIGWNWRKEALELFWQAAAQSKTNALALQSLWDLYSRTNETRELLRVAKAQLEIDPSNSTKKNNEAFLTLLLYGASERAERLAREASTANPQVPEWAATYAYALHLVGKEAEAKKVMENLPAEALARPGVALYYGIVLAANGETPQAKDTLAKLNPAGLLPEERKLADDLTQRLSAAAH